MTLRRPLVSLALLLTTMPACLADGDPDGELGVDEFFEPDDPSRPQSPGHPLTNGPTPTAVPSQIALPCTLPLTSFACLNAIALGEQLGCDNPGMGEDCYIAVATMLGTDPIPVLDLLSCQGQGGSCSAEMTACQAVLNLDGHCEMSDATTRQDCVDTVVAAAPLAELGVVRRACHALVDAYVD